MMLIARWRRSAGLGTVAGRRRMGWLRWILLRWVARGRAMSRRVPRRDLRWALLGLAFCPPRFRDGRNAHERSQGRGESIHRVSR